MLHLKLCFCNSSGKLFEQSKFQYRDEFEKKKSLSLTLLENYVFCMLIDKTLSPILLNPHTKASFQPYIKKRKNKVSHCLRLHTLTNLLHYIRNARVSFQNTPKTTSEFFLPHSLYFTFTNCRNANFFPFFYSLNFPNIFLNSLLIIILNSLWRTI